MCVPGLITHRVQKLVQRFRTEHVFYRPDDFNVTQVFPGEPEQMPTAKTGGISGRIGWLDLDFGAAHVATIGLTFRGL